MDFLVDGGRRRHPQKETAVYTLLTFYYPTHEGGKYEKHSAKSDKDSSLIAG
jgi:hypothetical protein